MRRLGLDIGTNSIGWILIENDKTIIDMGVRIFSDGRDSKSGTSLAVDRREARSARRRRDRYLGRRSAFLEILIRFGLMAPNADEARLLAELDPYVLRARGLDMPLEPYEFGRTLFHLNQRRGFKSNRKAERKEKESEDGKIALGAQALDDAMQAAEARTLGEFLAGRPEKRVRLNGENQSYDFYPQRRHIEEEFERLWTVQAVYHPALLTEEARTALHRVLFFQRPLKEQQVGVCSFVPTEQRLPKAHPLFQERRLYEEVNQLEIVTPGESAKKLTQDQRDHLIIALRTSREKSFQALKKLLKLHPEDSFNKETEARTKLTGNEVYAALSDKKRFGSRWGHYSAERQWEIISFLLNEENPDILRSFLMEECQLDREQAEATMGAPLPEGYGRLGETATRKILEALKTHVITYAEAVKQSGWHHSDDRTGEILQHLPYYGALLARDIPPGSQNPDDPEEIRFGKITNPTVHIGLRQLQKLINAILLRHGRPDEIVVELARDLTQSEDEKKKHQTRIKRDTEDAIRRGKILEEEGQRNTGSNRALLKLWEELNLKNVLDRRCPYCAEPVSIQQLFSDFVDVDHIIPYSRCLDDSNANKVIAHRHCNREKGNKTPFERWGSDPDRWDRIAAQAARMPSSKRWRFGPDALEKIEKDGGFLARQLTDTQYLSRTTGKYLRYLYPEKAHSVYVIPGRMTAMLRRLWGLNDLLPDHNYVENSQSNAPKNRLDHRHHAIDAAVVAVTTRSMLQQIANAAKRAEDKKLDKLFEDLPHPWEGFREDLRNALERVTISHKPDHGRMKRPSRHHDVTAGRLHNDTAYGLTGEMAPDGKTPIVVHRIPLLSLKPEQLEKEGVIPDRTLREALRDVTAGRKGKDFETALMKFRKFDGPFKGLRHLRIREALSVIPIHDANGRAYKAYKGDANARFDVWRMPDGKWVSDIVSMFDAHQPSQKDRRPHPAAKKMLSLRQNDMLAIQRDGDEPEFVRVVKFSTIGSIALAGNREAGALKARDANKEDPFKYILSSAGGLKKLKARQIRIDPLGHVFDPGPRD